MMSQPSRPDVVRRQVWAGADGFARLDRTRQLGVSDPDAFELARSTTRAAGVRITRWSLSALTGTRTPRTEPDAITIIGILDGSVRYWADDAKRHAGSGSVLVVRDRPPVRFSVDRRADVIEIRLPTPIPEHDVGDRLAATITAIPVTRTWTALLALAEYALDPARGRSTSAERAIESLSIAVVEEHVPPATETTLRERIVDYIEQHLTDPRLGPESIADAFGISIRWAHHVFTDGELTIGRHIRLRRIEVVIEHLDSGSSTPSTTALARDTGFTGRDTLARQFKAETGLTIQQYIASR